MFGIKLVIPIGFGFERATEGESFKGMSKEKIIGTVLWVGFG